MNLHRVRESKRPCRVPLAVDGFSLGTLLSLYATVYRLESPSRAMLRGKEHCWDRSSLLGFQPHLCAPNMHPSRAVG